MAFIAEATVAKVILRHFALDSRFPRLGVPHRRYAWRRAA
jgi:hypothetical protein